jgi:hypothetical protein
MSDELMSRTVVGLDAPALALAAGAAAALSIATGSARGVGRRHGGGRSAAPGGDSGLLSRGGEWQLAGRAALLLAINVVAVNLAALLVYFFKGVRPRTWLERRSAKRSVYVNAAVWLVLIVALSAIAAHFAASDGAGLRHERRADLHRPRFRRDFSVRADRRHSRGAQTA